MAAIRRAEATWTGDLARGSGRVTASSSQAFSDLPLTWASRTESADGRTSPEELIAAAHASCISMALSAGLGRAGTTPEQHVVSATVTNDQADGVKKVVSSALNVRGRVPGIDAAAFRQAAQAAKDGCPVSQALKGNVELSVDANLES
jgi:osmotically inducible protein OsmC